MRSEDTQKVFDFVTTNITSYRQAILTVKAKTSKESSLLVDHVLSTSFGYDKAFCGGEDDRVFVLNYKSRDLKDNTYTFLAKLKSDLNALIFTHSLKSAKSQMTKKIAE